MVTQPTQRDRVRGDTIDLAGNRAKQQTDVVTQAVFARRLNQRDGQCHVSAGSFTFLSGLAY